MTTKNDALHEKLKAIQDVLKEIPGVYLHDIRDYLQGTLSVSKRSNTLKLPLALPADELLSQPDDAGQVIRGEWKVLPLLMFVEGAAAS